MYFSDKNRQEKHGNFFGKVLTFECMRAIIQPTKILEVLYEKTQQIFTYVMMAVMMLFTGFATFGGVNTKKASALAPGYSPGTGNAIYYFCDLYPSIDYDTLQSEYGTYMNVVLDRQNMNNNEFVSLVNSGYFNAFGQGCIVVIDIKTFLPDSTVMHNLLYNLQVVQGCNVILTLPNISDYSVGEVHALYETDLSRMRNFVGSSLCYMNGGVPNDYRNLKILIDPNFINASAYYVDVMCDESPFVKILLEELEVANEADISLALHNRNIQICLYEGQGEYLDLFDSGIRDTFDTYAMGCWSLDSDFYNDLYAKQTNSDLSLTFMMEGNPIVYGSSGLRIMDEWSLAALYNSEETESGPLKDLITEAFEN